MSSPLPPARAPFFAVPLAVSMENSTPNQLASVRFSCPGLPLPFLPFVWVLIQGSWKPCPSHAILKRQGHKICCRLRVWSKAIGAFGSNLSALKTGSKAEDSVLSKRGFMSLIYLFLWSTSPCSCDGSNISGVLAFSRRMPAEGFLNKTFSPFSSFFLTNCGGEKKLASKLQPGQCVWFRTVRKIRSKSQEPWGSETSEGSLWTCCSLVFLQVLPYHSPLFFSAPYTFAY